MARTKSWIWITLALVCALSAGGLTYYLLQRQSNNATAEVDNLRAQLTAVPVVETVSVPVAARDLVSGTTLTPEDFVQKNFPVDLVATSAITDVEQLSGQILIEPVTSGDIFRKNVFVGGAGVSFSGEIEPGKTVIAFPISDLLSQTGVFVAGDRIDLLITRVGAVPDPSVPGDTGMLTGYSVQNVRIMRVLGTTPTETNPNPTPTALLIEISPEDAVMVKKVKDSGGIVELGLRSPADNEPFIVDPVTDGELLQLINEGPKLDAVGSVR